MPFFARPACGGADPAIPERPGRARGDFDLHDRDGLVRHRPLQCSGRSSSRHAARYFVAFSASKEGLRQRRHRSAPTALARRSDSTIGWAPIVGRSRCRQTAVQAGQIHDAIRHADRSPDCSSDLIPARSAAPGTTGAAGPCPGSRVLRSLHGGAGCCRLWGRLERDAVPPRSSGDLRAAANSVACGGHPIQRGPQHVKRQRRYVSRTRPEDSANEPPPPNRPPPDHAVDAADCTEDPRQPQGPLIFLTACGRATRSGGRSGWRERLPVRRLPGARNRGSEARLRASGPPSRTLPPQW